MCGRTASTRASGEIAHACTYRSKSRDKDVRPQWSNAGSSKYKPSFNNGPKSAAAILLKNHNYPSCDSTTCDGERVLLPMQWGLVPGWHKGDASSFSFNMINCRHDTMCEKKTFAQALQKGRRCVVLADGFYEWQTKSNGKKQPYYIQLKGGVKPHQNNQKQLITMAGLFEKHTSSEGEELFTYTIITVDASPSFKAIHHRMPAILETPEAVEKWLEVDSVSWKSAMNLLKPTDCLEWYAVSDVVNNVRNNTEDCLKKLELVKETAKSTGSGKLMSSWLKNSSKSKTEDTSKSATENTSTAKDDGQTSACQPPAKKQKTG